MVRVTIEICQFEAYCPLEGQQQKRPCVLEWWCLVGEAE